MKVEECEPCTYSPVSAVDYLPTGFSDTRQLSLLSGSHTPVKSYENEQQKDGFPTCECGKEMSDCLIHPNTPDKWIASMRDSLAKTLALLESRQVYLREPDQVFTEKSCVLLTSLDRDTCSWRTLQQSFLTDSEPFSQTWPRWGMTQGGYAYAHPMSERRITETGGSCWATPAASDGTRGGTITENMTGQSLPQMVNTPSRWPTPNASDNRDRGNMSNPSVRRRIAIGKQIGLSTAVKETSDGGTLNPDWTEWLMAFPIGFSDSKDWAMLKSRSRPQQHGDSLEVNK